MGLTVILITLNEEQRLRACLSSLPRNCEIVVVDSGSTDRTVALAKEYDAKVVQRTFTNFADQKNYAIGLATQPWILAIDADEVLHPDLRNAIESIVLNQKNGTKHAAYRLRRKLVFMDRLMNFGKTNDQPIRLFCRSKALFENPIHERLKVAGIVGKVRKGFIFHHSYRNLEDYFSRFNRYTSRIAEEHWRAGKGASVAHIMVRPWFEFLYRYIVRLGFLDGYPGYIYALNSSLYTLTKYAKTRELARSGGHPPP